MPSALRQAELAELLGALGASTLHEATGDQGRRGAMDAGVRPLEPGHRVSGPAATVACHPADNLAIHRALDVVERGWVLVVDAGGALAGHWGEILTAKAQRLAVAGLVIDGGVRDATAIAARAFPVFARGVSMLGTTKASSGELGGTVVCGGVAVRHGDWVIGDRDGVVALPAAEVDAILARARLRAGEERALLAKLDRAGAGR